MSRRRSQAQLFSLSDVMFVLESARAARFRPRRRMTNRPVFVASVPEPRLVDIFSNLAVRGTLKNVWHGYCDLTRNLSQR
jgi:hypothetical protein